MLLIVSFNFVCFTFSATPEREQQKAQARPWTEIFSLIELYLLHLSHKPACGLISLAEEDSLRSSMGVWHLDVQFPIELLFGSSLFLRPGRASSFGRCWGLSLYIPLLVKSFFFIFFFLNRWANAKLLLLNS